MAEIVGGELQADRFISADPTNGILSALDGAGAAVNLIAWSPITGDVTYSAPAGTGANTRVHRFDRPMALETDTFSLGGSTIASPFLTINGTDATHKTVRWQSGGITKWSVASRATSHDLRIDSAVLASVTITQAGLVTLAAGLTVTSGTSAFQAITATSIVATSTVTATGFIDGNTVSPASGGVLRLGNNNGIAWRNAGDTSNHAVKLNASNIFEFDAGVQLAGKLVTNTSANGQSFAATGAEFFANTTFGAGLGGRGTSYDVTLFNRSGSSVAGVIANTTLFEAGGNYFSANQINYGYSLNSAQTWYINYSGYQNGDTQYRTLNIGNGRQAIELTIGGATGGLLVGAAAGGQKGNGSINVAADIYKNNTAYTNPDFVFEAIFTGSIVANIDRPGAREFLEKFRQRGNRVMTLQEVRDHAERRHRLPGVGDAEGVFERADVALAQLELAYHYLFDHDARISYLERALHREATHAQT